MRSLSKRAPRPTIIILTCFLVSATVRLGAGGVAIAENHSTHAQENARPTPEEVTSSVPEPEIGSLLESIRTRQEQLSNREIEIAARQVQLNVLEQRIAEQFEILKQAERKLASTLAIADSAAENDLKQLTEVYEKMKAKSAAEIFGTMETSFAAGFLSRMRPESAAGILSEMPPNTAYSISVVMAGKNANAPTE